MTGQEAELVGPDVAAVGGRARGGRGAHEVVHRAARRVHSHLQPSAARHQRRSVVVVVVIVAAVGVVGRPGGEGDGAAEGAGGAEGGCRSAVAARSSVAASPREVPEKVDQTAAAAAADGGGGARARRPVGHELPRGARVGQHAGDGGARRLERARRRPRGGGGGRRVHLRSLERQHRLRRRDARRQAPRRVSLPPPSPPPRRSSTTTQSSARSAAGAAAAYRFSVHRCAAPPRLASPSDARGTACTRRRGGGLLARLQRDAAVPAARAAHLPAARRHRRRAALALRQHAHRQAVVGLGRGGCVRRRAEQLARPRVPQTHELARPHLGRFGRRVRQAQLEDARAADVRPGRTAAASRRGGAAARPRGANRPPPRGRRGRRRGGCSLNLRRVLRRYLSYFAPNRRARFRTTLCERARRALSARKGRGRVRLALLSLAAERLQNCALLFYPRLRLL